jgi:homoaconitase/3-isopropylmalate dehydratase large subunit
VEAWSGLASDRDAIFDREVTLDAGAIAPIVTWGTTPDDALPIDASVPDPEREADPARAKYLRDALDYTRGRWRAFVVHRPRLPPATRGPGSVHRVIAACQRSYIGSGAIAVGTGNLSRYGKAALRAKGK